MEELDRITFDKNIMAGRACIRGMRITVSTMEGFAFPLEKVQSSTRASDSKLTRSVSNSNEVLIDFADGIEMQVSILAGVLESIQPRTNPVEDVLVAWRKLIAKEMQNRKINLVGSMSIG